MHINKTRGIPPEGTELSSRARGRGVGAPENNVTTQTVER